MLLYGIVTGLALVLGGMFGVVSAEESFTLLKEIPVQEMSKQDMDKVQGKLLPYTPLRRYGFYYSTLGSRQGVQTLFESERTTIL